MNIAITLPRGLGLTSFFKKISERIENQGYCMFIKGEKQFHRFVLDSIPVAVVTMDYDFKITSFNTRAEELTGYSSDEAVGRPCYEILNSSRCEFDCPLQTIQEYSLSPSGLEAEMINRHGKQIPVRIGVASILNNDNDFIGYLEVIEDIFRQKRIEREKNNFINMIAHDMKSPLVGISGLIKRLKKEKICQTSEKLMEYLRVMGEADKRLELIIREFLEHSRLESDQIQLEQSEIALENILEQAIEILRIKAEDNNITLTYDCKPLTPIQADENRLHRAFTNIINNAIKYSPQQSEITISTQETDKEIVICFQDQGRGIKPDEIPYIFDAFYRSESNGGISGHGLGLAAARAIIRKHGGKISVESIPAKGSVFTVRLPKT